MVAHSNNTGLMNYDDPFSFRGSDLYPENPCASVSRDFPAVELCDFFLCFRIQRLEHPSAQGFSAQRVLAPLLVASLIYQHSKLRFKSLFKTSFVYKASLVKWTLF